MAYDGTDFEDTDYTAPRPANPGPSGAAGRAPTREELDAQLTGTQQQLAKLRETQEQLERARVALDEMRRRRTEFANGRAEMLQGISRGIGLLEKAENDARRDAEQMVKTLEGLREALANVQRLNEQAWTDETWQHELTHALTTIENARMEFNSARRKWPLLDGKTAEEEQQAASDAGAGGLARLPLGQLCKLGLALTWPLVLVAIAALGLFLFLLQKR